MQFSGGKCYRQSPAARPRPRRPPGGRRCRRWPGQGMTGKDRRVRRSANRCAPGCEGEEVLHSRNVPHPVIPRVGSAARPLSRLEAMPPGFALPAGGASRNRKQKNLTGKVRLKPANRPVHLSAKRIQSKPEGRSPGFWRLTEPLGLPGPGGPVASVQQRNREVPASYSGATTPDFHRLPFSAPTWRGHLQTIQIFKVIVCPLPGSILEGAPEVNREPGMFPMPELFC